MAECMRERTTDSYDICVVGGGLAGICAALAAARHGARTALVDDRPVLGGCSSTELRVPACGAGYHNPWGTETGIIHELILEDRARNHAEVGYGQANAIWEMVLYDACRREPSLEMHLNTCIDEVQMADARAIGLVSGPQSHSGTRLRIPARLFIDCSGDGCVGVGAGVPFRVGPEARGEYGESFAPEEPDDFVMGSSLIFRAVDTGREVPFEPPEWAERYDFPDGIPYRSTRDFTGGYWWIEIGWPLDTLHDDPQIRDELLSHLFGVWDHIKNRGREREEARTWALDWVGFLPARRESRRFVGAHVLTQQEIQGAERFPDTVAVGGWSIDDHTRGGITALDKRPSFDRVRVADYLVTPYPVPLRSLYAEEVENLLFAGRVLSASRVAFCSLRVQQTLATTGQAAGTAAAWCIERDCRPHEIDDPRPIQQRLLRDDAWLPGVQEDNLARDVRGARASASSEAALRPEAAQDGADLAAQPAGLMPVSEDRIERVALFLDNQEGEAEITLRIYRASNVWDLDALEREPLASATAAVPYGSGWVDVSIDMDAEPGALYWFRAEGPDEIMWRFAEEMAPGTAACHLRPDGTRWFAGGGRGGWRSMALRVAPESRPFGPDQAINGCARPDRAANLWISDPHQPLPQWLEVELAEPTEIDAAAIIFDTNLSRTNGAMPGLMRAPECVRDYRLEAEADGGWEELARVTGNYHRRREHRFEPVIVRRVRLTVEATNGDPSARVCALRLYRDGR
ncbi:MAG: FAD-dependent oxidoreductase [Armatimonadota bacterium]|nr:FAD-dependent oxidoreductase [Armatimonadota bacterium]